jgi:hypothetical protein
MDAPILLTDSASSHIYTKDGKCLKGDGGKRVYVLVDNARDIERVGLCVFERLFLESGRFEFSKDGKQLARGLVDKSVWQPSRLDFASGAALSGDLEQRRTFKVLNPNALPYVTSQVLDLTTDEHARLAALDTRRKVNHTTQTQRQMIEIKKAATVRDTRSVRERIKAIDEHEANWLAEAITYPFAIFAHGYDGRKLRSGSVLGAAVSNAANAQKGERDEAIIRLAAACVRQGVVNPLEFGLILDNAGGDSPTGAFAKYHEIKKSRGDRQAERERNRAMMHALDTYRDELAQATVTIADASNDPDWLKEFMEASV